MYLGFDDMTKKLKTIYIFSYFQIFVGKILARFFPLLKISGIASWMISRDKEQVA